MPLILTKPQAPENLPANVSETDAARFLGITPKKLRRLGYEKRGPKFIKIGRDHIYPRQGLIAWVEAQSN